MHGPALRIDRYGYHVSCFLLVGLVVGARSKVRKRGVARPRRHNRAMIMLQRRSPGGRRARALACVESAKARSQGDASVLQALALFAPSEQMTQRVDRARQHGALFGSCAGSGNARPSWPVQPPPWRGATLAQCTRGTMGAESAGPASSARGDDAAR